jgi:hypothetical protein
MAEKPALITMLEGDQRLIQINKDGAQAFQTLVDSGTACFALFSSIEILSFRLPVTWVRPDF